VAAPDGKAAAEPVTQSRGALARQSAAIVLGGEPQSDRLAQRGLLPPKDRTFPAGLALNPYTEC